MSQFPRRIQMLKWVPAERMIADAMQEVESMGADLRLTDAVDLLGKARDRVADFVDGVPGVSHLRPAGASREPSAEPAREGIPQRLLAEIGAIGRRRVEFPCPRCGQDVPCEPSSIGSVHDRLLYFCPNCGTVSEERGIEAPPLGASPERPVAPNTEPARGHDGLTQAERDEYLRSTMLGPAAEPRQPSDQPIPCPECGTPCRLYPEGWADRSPRYVPIQQKGT